MGNTRGIRTFVRSVSMLTVATIAFSGALVLGAAESASAAAGSITGRVFRDFNANGLYDVGAAARSGIAIDTGIAGVTVTAYDANDDVFGSTVVSATDGTYTLTGTGAVTAALRVEFSTLPDGYEETPVFSSTGTRSGTSVQFVSIGATEVNFGASVPEDYSQDNPPLVTAMQYSGLPTSTSATFPAVVGQPYSENINTGSNTTFTGRTTLATFQDVGSVWGVAYDNVGNNVFAAATYKRHSGLGTLGLGGIYRITDAVTAGAVSASGTTVDPWLDVTTLGINVGTVPTNSARGLSTGNTPVTDIDAFAQASKVGIGGIAVNREGTVLYFVNLFDKSLYSINISDIDNPSVAAVTPLGLAVGERPWAVTVHDDSIYIGYVETGETDVVGVATANPGRSADSAGLDATVLSTPLPVTAGSVFATAATIDLGYTKGAVFTGGSPTAQELSRRTQWHTWADTWAWGGADAGSVAVGLTGTTGTHLYPQAMLSGLTFDADNYLTIGLADRTGTQGGNRNYRAIVGSTSPAETMSGGDILLAAPNAAGTVWTPESAAAAGSRSASGTPTGRSTNSQGLGGGEFYADSNNRGTSNTSAHLEVSLGAVTAMRGTNEVVTTAFDPLANFRVSGLNWLSTTTGAGLAGYNHTADPGNGTISLLGTFQKGGGLGGVQFLSEQAPLEIGNRVWFDADQDGLQDADEPPLSDVTVELYQGATLLGTRTTAADGSYYFSSDDSSPFFVAGFVPNGGDYRVAFVKPTTGNVAFTGAAATTFGTVPWSTLSLTAPNSAAATDLTDSDADASGNVTYTAGAAGVSDHSIDAGYVADATFSVTKELASGSGAASAGQTFSILAQAVDFRGAPYVIPDSPFTLAAGATSATVTVPAGTLVTVSETNGGLYRSAVVSPSTATLVTPGTDTSFTVTNDLFDNGRFQVTKDVTGPGAALITGSPSFTVQYTYPGLATPKTLTVTDGATSALSDPIPYGTVVTLSEVLPTAPAGVGWNTPSWSELSGTGTVADQGNGTATITIGDASTLVVGLDNPTTVTPGVTILRGDQVGLTYHAADTIAAGQVYAPGSTRDIVFTVTNSGTEVLKNVTLGDDYTSGPQVSDITWTFPDGSSVTAPAGTDAQWPNSFDGTSTWAVGAVITGTATLTLESTDEPHIATATVDAVGVVSDDPVADSNDYNAFTGAIQVIKYDGNEADPAIADGAGDPITPTKAGIDDGQDADTLADAVLYPVNVPQTVRLVVTNTGTTSLTNISLADLTSVGPAIDSEWEADLSALGGPSNFSFAGGAEWTGVLRPGESFYATTTLTLDVLETHTGEVTVLATVVVPALDGSGVPNGEPTFDGSGDPVVALTNGSPATVTDDDPFNAETGVGPEVGIKLGDGTGSAIANDADTMPTAEVYQNGETRTVVFRVVNTGTEALEDVVIDHEVFAGADLVGPLVWTFPDGSTATATMVGGKLVVEWPNSFDGTSTWAPGDVIIGTALLTLNAADDPHVSVTTVTAVGAFSGVTVTAADPYNAFTGAIQVIEYDGESPDPVVKDADGNWVIPTKPSVPSGQDADGTGTAVTYDPNVANTVRWVITNTGTTAMTNITLTNLVASGTAIGDDWTADLSPFGGPADYNFAASGPWTGILLPGQSFFAEGTLTLPAGGSHSNTVTVTAEIIIPEVDGAGLPTGAPSLDTLGLPNLAVLSDGGRFIVTASDPFYAIAAGTLAYTGVSLVGPALIAIQLLLAGAVLLLFTTRRRITQQIATRRTT